MRHYLARQLLRLAGWLGRRGVPPALTGAAWPGPGTLDAYRRLRTPSDAELLAELKNTAWSCASINAAVCASFPPRLYVATHDGQPAARCARAALTPAAELRLRQNPALTQTVARAHTLEEVLDHPLLTLLRQVNPVHNSHDLWELTTLYQEVHGSAYWHLTFDALGLPEAIWVLPPQQVTPRRTADSPRPVDYYDHNAGGRVRQLGPREVIHFRYPDPRDPYRGGLSPLRACYEQVTLASDYAAMRRAIYDNQALPGAIISPAEVMGAEERERLEAQWQQKFRRGGAGKVLVAETALRVDVLRQSMGDLSGLAEAAATRDDIATAFHVPLALLTKDTNLANLEASTVQHMALAIRPRLRRRDEKLNEQLLPHYDPTGRLFVAADDPVPESREQRLRQQELDLRLGVRSINEVRQERGLPPVAWGAAPWLPLTWAPADDRSAKRTLSVDDED